MQGLKISPFPFSILISPLAGGAQNQAQPQSTSTFGGGFGATANKTAGGLFGAAPQQQIGGAQPQQGGGLFGAPAAQPAALPTQGSSYPAYRISEVIEDDNDTSGGKKSHKRDAISIVFMPEYSNVSVEELRVQDYQQGRKTGNGGQAAGGFSFGQPSQTTGGFGQPAAQPSGGLFGAAPQQNSNPFGATQNNNTGGLFGGQQQQQTGGLFGQQQPQQQGGLFGASTTTQPAQGGGLFGSTAAQPAQSTGFSFGQTNNNQPASSTAGGFSFGGAQQQQNKPAFGGFGQTSTTPNQPSQPFSFGGQQQQQQQPAAGAFGAPASSASGFSFGAPASNAPKPGGLFGAASQAPATSTAPAFSGFGAQQNNAPKPGGFSFGGFGASTSGANAPQTSAPAPTGGLFGNTQPAPTSQPGGGLFGNNNASAPAAGGFSFGQPAQQHQQPAAGGFGGGLFGGQNQNKPATGGLFGSAPAQQPQQPASTGFGGGGLFGGAAASKPGGFSFGAPANNQTQQQGGGLFGSNQPAGGSSLFGANQPAAQGATGGGFSFGSSTNTGGNLFGQSQNNNQQPQNQFGQSQNNQQPQNQFGQSQNQPQQQFQQPGLDRDPYGTDALFSQIGGVPPGQGPVIPFSLTQKKKSQPPLTIPFRSSPSSSGNITRLRGRTPTAGLGSSVSGGARSGTPGRQTTPGAHLFAGTSVYGRSASPSVFRAFSDEQSLLSPQAFVSRPSVKRLNLDEPGASGAASGFGSSRSVFGPRAGSSTALLEGSPSGNSFSRGGTAPAHRGVAFSPAAESAARLRQSSVNAGPQSQNDPDASFASSVAPRRGQLFSDELPAQRRKEVDPASIVSSTPLGKPNRKASLPLNNVNSSPNTSLGGVAEADLQEGDYFTEPPIQDIRNWSFSDLQSVHPFVVGRKGFGQIEFLDPVDLTSLPDLSDIAGGVVQIRLKECFVYPDLEDCRAQDGVKEGYRPVEKAPRGEGLNVPAKISLDKCWPLDRSTRQPVTDASHPRVKQLINKLQNRKETDFDDYKRDTGTWSFIVQHFSRWGLDDSDDEEDAPSAAAPATSRANNKRGLSTRGSRTRSNRQVVSESEEDEDAPPPVRRLDEASSSSQTEDEDELQSPSEISEDMRESELGDGVPDRKEVWKQFDTPVTSTPRAVKTSRDRSSTPRGITSTPSRAERAVSQTPQPWAATLGLEARRVQVMQASFFGQEKEKEVVRNNASTSTPPPSRNQKKHSLPASSSHKKPESSQRQNFSQPSATTLCQTVAPARKLARTDLAQSVVKGSDGIFVDAGLALGRSFRVGWGPDGTIIHNGGLVGVSAGAG